MLVLFLNRFPLVNQACKIVVQNVHSKDAFGVVGEAVAHPSPRNSLQVRSSSNGKGTETIRNHALLQPSPAFHSDSLLTYENRNIIKISLKTAG